MRFTKKVPYKLKRLIPMLGLAGATLLPTACEKEEPLHDTTYMWGRSYWEEIYPADNVCASADSVQVRNVILKNNGTNWGGGYTAEEIRDYLLMTVNQVPEQNRHKLRGAGKLTWVKEGGDPSAKAWLENFGFRVLMVDESRNTKQR